MAAPQWRVDTTATLPIALSNEDARRSPAFLASPQAVRRGTQKGTLYFFAGKLRWMPVVLGFLSGLPAAQPAGLAVGEVPSHMAQTLASSDGASEARATTLSYRFDIPS